ncbi:MAG: NTP transferase domain-containing protein [Deltaproteobacteria bacterium]|jgi:choline kinase|nr:NTP transferase domain-containing protein [Deltaproteobacteria bacterium]
MTAPRRAERAIILAAGFGSRLADGRPVPKPLREVAGVPLIIRIIRGLERGGVREIGIVIGYLGDDLRRGLLEHEHRAKLSFFVNDEYEKPNGTSLLKARDFVTGPTLLLMSDHLWSPKLLSSVSSYAIGQEESALGVDYRIDACFDLDDATKVQVDDGRIVRIGKELGDYNALDTGLFLITPALIDALDAVNGPDGCSLSEGVAALAGRGRMRGIDVGDATWIDVDTPEAHAEAERLISVLGDELDVQPAAPADHSRVTRRSWPRERRDRSVPIKKAQER